MRQLDLARNRIAGATAALAVVAALAVSTPVARADDATGTPTPATSTSASGTSGTSSTDPTTTDPTSATTSATTTASAPTTTTTTSTPPPTTPPTTPPPTTTAPAPRPVPVLSAGSGTWRVKDLQVRLRLVRSTYWPYAASGTWSTTLTQKVTAFQRDQRLPAHGVVDQRTWSRLVALTATPTAAGRFSSAATLRELQLRLRASGLWRFSISGTWSTTLAQRVLVYQRGRGLPQSGVVDYRTWNHLVAHTYRPGTWDRYRYQAGSRPLLPKVGSLDPRCRTGRVMCVSKDTRTLTWVVDGKPLMAMWARFGGPGRETREGTFRVSRKYEYVISNLYFTPMPYSMFFSGGQAVHYSSNFARLGYASSSHGCVNIADHAQVKSLFFKVRVGDKVVVYS
jgi:peptidoglycan hydrolase-like protein with peptidoglycan-binding domain